MEKDMTENNLKRGSLTVRLNKDLLDKYKDLCDKKGYDMSKRIRLYIESELKNELNSI